MERLQARIHDYHHDDSTRRGVYKTVQRTARFIHLSIFQHRIEAFHNLQIDHLNKTIMFSFTTLLVACAAIAGVLAHPVSEPTIEESANVALAERAGTASSTGTSGGYYYSVRSRSIHASFHHLHR